MSSGVKKCSKCDKSVYPMELLKCLDQFWHKTCFKCAVCDMTLNMKNYKGYEKRPYCQVHYPTTKFTSVADTPENKRIAENTRNQSQINYSDEGWKDSTRNVTYHKAFEDARGQYTPVAADVEMTRLLQNQERVSLINYHKDFEEKKGHYITVVDSPELQRILENQQQISLVQYHKDFENSRGKYTQIADDPEVMRHLENTQKISTVEYRKDFEKSRGQFTTVADDPEIQRLLDNTQKTSKVLYQKQFEDSKGKYTQIEDDAEMMRLRGNQELYSLVKYHEDFEKSRGKCSQDAGTAEMKRLLDNQEKISMVQYVKDFEESRGKVQSVHDDPVTKRVKDATESISMIAYHKDFEQTKGRFTAVADDPETRRARRNSDQISTVQYHAQFEKQKGQKISVESDPELQRSKKNMETISQVNYQGWKDKKDHMEKRRPSDAEYTPGISAHPNFGRQDPVVMASITRQDFHQTDNYPTEMKPGSIFDRDPLAAELGKSDINYNSPYKARSHSQVIYSGSARRDDNDDQRPRSGSYGQDPMNGQYTANQRSSGGDFKVPYGVPPQARPTKEEEVAPYVAAPDPVTPEPITEPVFTPPEPIVEPQVEDAPPPSTLVQPPPAFSSQPRYIAMYDYSAADVDEVSFVEGDIIIDHESIDEGWMMGTVQRTGIRGMLPANYVELQA